MKMVTRSYVIRNARLLRRVNGLQGVDIELSSSRYE